MFRNRTNAAFVLAQELKRRGVKQPLVLAIPRGAVPMGKVIADELDGNLDIVLVHKIRSPDQPEFAIGAVAESGEFELSPALGVLGISEDLVTDCIEHEINSLRQKRSLYGVHSQKWSPRGRTIVLVDDGLATGHTMLLAVKMLKKRGPKKIIVCAPVASKEAISKLKRELCEIVVLEIPYNFNAVGDYYDDFRPVTDAQVVSIIGTEEKIKEEMIS